MNNVTVVGNLTEDAKVQKFGDQKFISMKIADNIYQGKDKDDHVNYYDICILLSSITYSILIKVNAIIN